ncbi:MAG TPA: SGNH/GDSL hydrolase family protein, partial [Pirellulaceae bacterium]|nr:SGNH/GDSL hydrolase family protein [Pirellulaceae bacterium]
ADGAPFQPPYQDLLRLHLEARFQSKVELTNLSVGGTDTAWGLAQVEKVAAAKPQLVLLAFGMNDSSGRSAADYQANIVKIMAAIRAARPECEFILIAPMLGNRDWIRLKHELFPEYRDSLAKLREPGVALADLTAVWDELLKVKKDWDLTGNGVNHPNDFGHRLYAQVLSALLVSE